MDSRGANFNGPELIVHVPQNNNENANDSSASPDTEIGTWKFWIFLRGVVNVCFILAATIVLSYSRDVHPGAPLFNWVVGYAVGCAALLPCLCWRYHSIPQGSTELADSNPASARNNIPHVTATTLTDCVFNILEKALCLFFLIWLFFWLAYIEISRHPTDQEINLFRLSQVFWTFSCLRHLLTCTVMLSANASRRDVGDRRASTSESNPQQIYKFKTELQEHIQIEHGDTVCCICLDQYVDGEQLRKLLCNHFFHKDCVDKWLVRSALCPLCRSEVGSSP